MENRAFWVARIYFIGLLLVAVTLPFAKHYNSWMVGVVILAWLGEGKFREKWQRLQQHRWWFYALAFYLLHVVALFYTEDTAKGGFILEKKSGLWLIPLLIATGPAIAAHQLKLLLRVFIGACTVGIVICIGMASFEWLQSHDLEAFSHHRLSKHIGLHAIYFSAYLVFGLFVIGQWLFQGWEQLTNLLRIALSSWMALLMLMVLLLASKTLILTLALLGSSAWLFWFIRQKKTLTGIFSLLGVFVLLMVGIFALPDTRERFLSVLNGQFEVVKMDKYVYSTPFNGLTLRLVLWKFGAEVMEEEEALLLGVGPGDVQSLMDSTYVEHGIYTGNVDLGDHGYLGYNLHNQFIQSYLGLGWIGLLTLIAWLGTVLWKSWREGRWLALLLLAEVFFFSLSESTLETHHGTMLLAFWGSILLVYPHKLVK